MILLTGTRKNYRIYRFFESSHTQSQFHGIIEILTNFLYFFSRRVKIVKSEQDESNLTKKKKNRKNQDYSKPFTSACLFWK